MIVEFLSRRRAIPASDKPWDIQRGENTKIFPQENILCIATIDAITKQYTVWKP